MISTEHRIYLALWRKAVKQNSEVKVQLRTPSEAMSFRRAMYRALLPFKLMKEHDSVLSEAIERFGVYQPKIDGNGQDYCLIRERQGYGMAQSLMTDFGLSEEDLMTEEERESFDHVNPQIPGILTPLPPSDDLPDNPFFNRED